VGYGADPDACCELAEAHCDLCLVGNHDLAVRGEIPMDEFSTGARLAAEWTQEVISGENLEYLGSLVPELLDREVGLYHASPRDPVWEYVISTLLADLCLDVQRHRVCLIGHSHVALSFRRTEGEPATGETRPEGTVLDLSESEWLLNPGSVGQPRDGDPRAAWMVLDTGGWAAAYRRTAYDVAGAQAAIRAARLPDSLAERLEYGQ
jgi:diadenosine tetraphosphatase ApaH/serine/threonine PP2A family protein phosphatase